MRLAAADEDRRPAVAVTCGTAALLATELLAGARHIAAFAGGTSRTTALFERSEEHTSELQSLMRISYAVFCLKKKNQQPSCRKPPTTRVHYPRHRHKPSPDKSSYPVRIHNSSHT